MPLLPTRTVLLAVAALQLCALSAAQAQQYDVNAILQEKAQIQQYFDACRNGFAAGMDQNLQNYLETGQYGVTGNAQGCDYNTMSQLVGRSYQLDLMLARANGDTRAACEIQWVPGCPEPGGQ